MIKINKKFKIIHRLLDKSECDSFIYCLTLEKSRHEIAIDDCNKMFKLFGTSIIRGSIVVKRFYECQIKRHEKDIEMINETIKYLINKFYGDINEITGY